MGIFDVDIDTIDTDIFKIKYNSCQTTAYKGYEMVKIRSRNNWYKSKTKYFVIFSFEENTIYVNHIIGHVVQEKELKYNNLTAYDVDCIIQKYSNQLLTEEFDYPYIEYY